MAFRVKSLIKLCILRRFNQGLAVFLYILVIKQKGRYRYEL